MNWSRPEVLALLLVTPWLLRRADPIRGSVLPFVWAGVDPIRRSVRRWVPLPRVLTALGAAGLVVLAAGPTVDARAPLPPEARVAVQVVLDVSGSMRESGPAGSALDRTREAVRDLARERRGVRFGLTTFAGSAVTRLPPTSDTTLLFDALATAEVGVTEAGSAIGTALGLAVDRLGGVEAAERIVVLVSDGRHNAGAIAPETAADLAREAGITLHALLPGTTFGDPVARRMGAIAERAGGTVVSISASEDLSTRLGERIPATGAPGGAPVRRPVAAQWWLLPLGLIGSARLLRGTRLVGAAA